MPDNSNNYCHKILIVLGLVTISVCLIVVSFGLALTTENNQILLDATVERYGMKQRAFRVASCDVAACTNMKTAWKTVVLPASTVTETTTIHVLGHGRPTQPATIELDSSETITLMPHIMPTGVADEPEKRKKSIRGGSRGRQIVDVNKPEMQM